MDLKGQLSIPSTAVESLAGQGSRRSVHLDHAHQKADSTAQYDAKSGHSEEKGRLSNPAQRRLADHDIDDLVASYETSSTIDTLAQQFGIHRTTVMTHLERHGVRRRSPRKLTDEKVAGAARRYTGGETLAEIAANLGIAPSTLTRELQLAGITIRRRGRPPSR